MAAVITIQAKNERKTHIQKCSNPKSGSAKCMM